MIGQLRSELLKQRSTQTTLYLFLAMFGLVALAVAMHVLALGKAQLSTNEHQLEVFQIGTRAGMLFAGLAGALTITGEIRFGTIRPTFLVAPQRTPLIAAKLAVGGLVGIIYGLLAEGLMTACATVAFSLRGIPNELTGSGYTRLVAGAAALWAISESASAPSSATRSPPSTMLRCGLPGHRGLTRTSRRASAASNLRALAWRPVTPIA